LRSRKNTQREIKLRGEPKRYHYSAENSNLDAQGRREVHIKKKKEDGTSLR